MSAGFAAVLVTAIALPHVLRFDRTTPALAALVWLGVLVLRALTALLAAVTVFVVMPSTQVFSLITHWCWHAALPLMAAHLGLDGHRVGDAALVLPGDPRALRALGNARRPGQRDLQGRAGAIDRPADCAGRRWRDAPDSFAARRRSRFPARGHRCRRSQ